MSLYFYFFHSSYSFLHRFSHSRHSIFILLSLLVLLHKPAASILEPPHKPFWWLRNIPSHQVLSFTWKVSISWFFSSFLFSVISDITMIHFVSTSVYSWAYAGLVLMSISQTMTFVKRFLGDYFYQQHVSDRWHGLWMAFWGPVGLKHFDLGLILILERLIPFCPEDLQWSIAPFNMQTF